MSSTKRRLSTYLLLITMVVIWGVNFSLVKWALSELSPLAFNAVRFTLASGLIFALLLLKEGWRPVPPVDMLKIFGLGLLGNSVFQVLFIEGIWRTTAGNSSGPQFEVRVRAVSLHDSAVDGGTLGGPGEGAA